MIQPDHAHYVIGPATLNTDQPTATRSSLAVMPLFVPKSQLGFDERCALKSRSAAESSSPLPLVLNQASPTEFKSASVIGLQAMRSGETMPPVNMNCIASCVDMSMISTSSTGSSTIQPVLGNGVEGM